MEEFLLGVTAAGCFVISLFFARFWRATGDRFFLLMSLGFAIFAANRVVLSFLDENSEARPAAYTVRLLAFAMIVFAILSRGRAQE
jgi:hypothetical protein